MQRKRPKKVSHKEHTRNYIVERDPNPRLRWYDCDFEEMYDEHEWH